MNDKQLALFLQKYSILLTRALEDIEQEIPEELKEPYKDLAGFNHVRIPIISDLYDLQDILEEDIETLLKES